MASHATWRVEEKASDAPLAAEADSKSKGVYHFLDVGGLKYGDCQLVEFGDIRVLIDGSHREDFRGQQGYKSTPEQLDSLLDGERPYKIDLVIVTHGHADHIGCLPDLVSNNVIKADFALLTDPKLGFGRTKDEDAPAADALSASDVLAALLREEDASDLNDEDLANFVDAVQSVEQRYAQFIDGLKTAGTEVIIHNGGPLPQALADRLAPTGATLLGPSLEQLVFCAEQIAKTNKEAQDLVSDSRVDSMGDVIALYRAVTGASDAAANPRGNGMNCQSITLAFGPPGERVLLAGDMQFAEPGVKGADNEVAKLRQRVADAGPYRLYKTTHHTSHNGQNAAWLEQLGNPPLLVHSGGIHDESHPFPKTLQMLAGRQGITFARTDHNGLITVRPDRPDDQAITCTRGTLNDFEPNREPDTIECPGVQLVERPSGTSPIPGVATARGGPQVIIVNLPPGPIDMTVGGVDIQVRGDADRSSASTRLSQEPASELLPERQAGGDPTRGRFSSLLFLTDSGRLAQNVGRAEADAALQRIRGGGGEIVDSSGDGLRDACIERLRQGQRWRGVVLLGGYDVVPPRRLDVLPPRLRETLTDENIRSDADEFLVWSDIAYGDVDNDAIAEVPVSRVPDGREAKLFDAALSAIPFTPKARFGIRNVARPFAESVFKTLKGTGVLGVSKPLLAKNVKAADLAPECHYFMLHGSDEDARSFFGESDGSYPVAFHVSLVPSEFAGVVFSGCCWGALIVDHKASASHTAPAPRVAESSIALSYLRAGANAFIGCTGSHYSGPSIDPDENYAARLHGAFWDGMIRGGFGPAESLHRAKELYMQEILSRGGRLNAIDTARRLKNFAQFTCLGLGW